MRVKCAIAAVIICMGLAAASAVGQTTTSFTYQGRLSSSGTSVDGPADFQFRLFDALNGGNQLGTQNALSNTPVTKGIFTATLDFGPVFGPGQPAWLEIAVRSPAGTGPFTMLSPRQLISAAPLAQGIAGLPIAFEPEALDQSQTGFANDKMRLLGPGASNWQSFTAGVTGRLTRVQLIVSDGLVFVSLHRGLGPEGEVLAIGVAESAAPASSTVSFSDANVTAGQVYTLVLAAGGTPFLKESSVTIPGASGQYLGSPKSWWFQTYVHPRPLIDAVATSVAWSGVMDQPSIFPPWAATTGGVFYSGTVGIGTDLIEGGLSVTSFKQNLSPTQPGVHMGRECCSYSSSTAIEIVADAGGSPVVDFNVLPSDADFGARLRYDAANDVLSLDGAQLCAATFCPSSITLKENVVPLANALDLLIRLQGVRFDWKPEEAPKHPAAHDLGFIAEDVDRVFPELIVKSPDGRVLGMDYARLTSVAVEAIKQLKNENDRIKADYESIKSAQRAMQARNAELEARLERLEKALGVPRGENSEVDYHAQ